MGAKHEGWAWSSSMGAAGTFVHELAGSTAAVLRMNGDVFYTAIAHGTFLAQRFSCFLSEVTSLMEAITFLAMSTGLGSPFACLLIDSMSIVRCCILFQC